MKAKNIIMAALAAATLITSAVSCDFLDTYDPSSVTTDYFNTKKGQERLIVNLYGRYRSVYNNRIFQDFGTDMYLTCSDTPTNNQFGGYNKDFSGLSGLDGNWQLHYKVIQEVNILMNRCTEELAGSDYARMTAEGRFFRALSYYYLVETYGAVPLLLEEPDEIIKKVTRNSEKEVYEFIISELEAIKGILPETSYQTGRVNDATVRIVLGKAYLTRAYRDYAVSGDLDKAATLFQSVIDSESYELLSTFEGVFDESNQGNAEIIWSIQYGSDKNFHGGGNWNHIQYAWNICGLYPGHFINDQSQYPNAQRNIWTNPIVHQWFRHPEVDVRYDYTFRREFYINDPTNKNVGKLGIYMPRWNDNSNDSRDAEFFFPYLDDDGNYNWVPAFPMMGWTTDCMPMCQKFKETKIKWGEAGSREDIVFRMADVYFLLAETYIKQGKNAEAMELVNAILHRAANHNEDAYNLIKVETAADMTIDRLLEEKGAEMFGEHDRWYDLKRTGTLLSRVMELNPVVKHFDNLSEMHLVRPIPYSEKIKLEGLEQNPGYRN